VGTVTERAVAAGSPPSVPSSVEERFTGVEPLPPLEVISAANEGIAIQNAIESARPTARILVIVFFIVKILLFV
jgi:hypothetical protein